MLRMELKVDKCHKYPALDWGLCIQILFSPIGGGRLMVNSSSGARFCKICRWWEAGCRLMPVQFAGGTRTLCPHSQMQAGSGRMLCLWSSPVLPGRAPSRGSGSAQGQGEPSTQGQRELMDCSCCRDFSWYNRVSFFS